MDSDHRWKWAGIVSVVSVGGVLLTDVVANVISGFISDQIKTWQVPLQAPPAKESVPPQAEAMVSGATVPPAPQAQVTMAAVTPRTAPPPAETVVAREPEPLPSLNPSPR
jgi:hypothetical protein